MFFVRSKLPSSGSMESPCKKKRPWHKVVANRWRLRAGRTKNLTEKGSQTHLRSIFPSCQASRKYVGDLRKAAREEAMQGWTQLIATEQFDSAPTYEIGIRGQRNWISTPQNIPCKRRLLSSRTKSTKYLISCFPPPAAVTPGALSFQVELEELESASSLSRRSLCRSRSLCLRRTQ